jgi:hypothetical protein
VKSRTGWCGWRARSTRWGAAQPRAAAGSLCSPPSFESSCCLPQAEALARTWEEGVLRWAGVPPHGAVQLLSFPQHILQQRVAAPAAVIA